MVAKAKKPRTVAWTIRVPRELPDRVKAAAAKDGNRPYGNFVALILARACEESERKAGE